MSPNTIRRGLADQKQPLEDSPYRVRQPGGGRKPVEKKIRLSSRLWRICCKMLRQVIRPRGVNWTHKSIRRLCRTLRVAVHRCSSSCFAEVFAREHGHHWTTTGVSGYGPWLVSTWRSLIRCSRRGCRRHRRTRFRTSRSQQTLHPSTPPALRSLRLPATVMVARCQRTTPQPPPPSTQTPIALAVCKSRSLSRSVRTSGFPFHSLSPA